MRIRLRGSIRDACDVLAAMGRANLRALLADEDLAREAVRRFDANNESCCFRAANPRDPKQVGCHCQTGMQYETDEDIQVAEGCKPDDVWSDLRSLLHFHARMGRGRDDPVLGDCDDLSTIVAAFGKFVEWLRVGRDEMQIFLAIVCPDGSPMAHAYILQDVPAPPGEPTIIRPQTEVQGATVEGLRVYDPSARYGMRRPPDSYYLTGEHAAFPLRIADL